MPTGNIFNGMFSSQLCTAKRAVPFLRGRLWCQPKHGAWSGEPGTGRSDTIAGTWRPWPDGVEDGGQKMGDRGDFLTPCFVLRRQN